MGRTLHQIKAKSCSLFGCYEHAIRSLLKRDTKCQPTKPASEDSVSGGGTEDVIIHQHFSIDDLKNLHALLEIAPVDDIQERRDSYFDTGDLSNMKKKKKKKKPLSTWLRMRAGPCGPVEWLERECEAKRGEVHMTIRSTTDERLEEKAARLERVAEFNFTRYTLDTSGLGDDTVKVLIDVVEVAKGDYVVLGTIDVGGGRAERAERMDRMKQNLDKIIVTPVPSKVLLVMRRDKQTTEAASDILQGLSLVYREPAIFNNDPLGHHKLVEGTDLAQWFASVCKGQLEGLHAELCRKYDNCLNFWQLSILNEDDLSGLSCASREKQQLLLYARAFSHYHWYDLAESPRVDPNCLTKEEWFRISLLNEDELRRYGNVPADVANYYRTWSAKAMRPYAPEFGHK